MSTPFITIDPSDLETVHGGEGGGWGEPSATHTPV